MGILDDAIREHLELKRQHGGAEEEVLRQEQEALGPARRDVPQQHEDEAAPADGAEDKALFDGEGSPADAAGAAAPEDHPPAEPDETTLHEPAAAEPTLVEPPPVESPAPEEHA